MLRLTKKFLKIASVGFVILLFFLTAWYVIAQARYESLSTNVETYVADEFDKLQFADEVPELRYERNNGCRRELKTGRTRCSIMYTRYYVSDAVPVEEFKRIDAQVRGLGWTDWSGSRDTEGEINQKFEKGIITFGIYTLKGQYNLDMHVSFYNEDDKDDLNDTIRSFVNKYVDGYPTIYRVSIDADFVND